MNHIFTFPSEDEASVFKGYHKVQELGIDSLLQGKLTDYAIINGAHCSCNWATRSGEYYEHTSPYNMFVPDDDNYIGYLISQYESSSNKFDWFYYKVNDICNSRPSFPYSSINEEDIIAKKYFASLLIIEYGEYPQTIEEISLSKKLESKRYTLKSTWKKYTDSNNKHNKIEEYEYMEHKYVRVVAPSCSDGKILSDGRRTIAGNVYWFRVEPIRWFINSQKDIAISEKILFPIKFRTFYRFSDPRNFSETYPYHYLNKIFSKQIKVSKKYLDYYRKHHSDVNITICQQLSEKEITSLFEGIDIFAPSVNITLTDCNKDLINRIKKECPSYINLTINISDSKKIDNPCANDSEYIYISEINDLIASLESKISYLSDNIKIKMYDKLSYIIEDYRNKLDAAKEWSLTGKTKNTLTTDNVDPKYLNQELFVKLTYFLNTLNKKPYLSKLLDNINNILNYIDNKSNIKCENNLTFNIVKIINIRNLINNPNWALVVNNIKDILNSYKNEISNELNSLTEKNIELTLPKDSYEECILRDINNIWNNISDNKLLLLIYQIYNCKILLENNSLNIIPSSDEIGINIQNKIIEISNALNNFSENVRQEIICKINNSLDECLKIINENNMNEMINSLNKLLLNLSYNLEFNRKEIKYIYGMPEIRTLKK